MTTEASPHGCIGNPCTICYPALAPVPSTAFGTVEQRIAWLEMRVAELERRAAGQPVFVQPVIPMQPQPVLPFPIEGPMA